jgi:predicted ester cyclase
MESRSVETTATFVLRFRREWTGAEGRWRGRIEHVQSGRRSDFLGVGELLGFLEGFGIHGEAETGEQRRSSAGATSGDVERSKNRGKPPTIPIKEKTMSAENKAVIDRLTQAFNEGNLDALGELVAANFVGHIPLPPGVLQGVDGLKGFFAAMRAAMPDVRHPSWTLIGEGDLVMIHMPTEGTFTNPLMGIPPNGKKVVVWMANIWRLDEGKAVEWWLTMDTLGFMQQLGVIPDAAA